MARDNTYKIRSSQAGSKEHPYTAYAVTIPTHIAAAIADLDDKRFTWEFTDEGLLLRPVVDQPEAPVEVPEWAR